MIQNKKAAVVFTLVVSVVAFAMEGCFSNTPTPPTVYVLSARRYVDEAWELALQWRSDAELKEIKANIATRSVVSPTYVDFTFESPLEEETQFVVSCSTAGCSGLAISVPFTSGWGSIELEDEMIDSVEAALIGLRNGGEQFLYRGKGVTMTVSLLRDRPRTTGPVVWEACFATLESAPLCVVIDPYSGEVIRAER
ncbi:MAG TPA: hypothetical protein ENK08_05585 [Chloroflexi bacterium]|nr:hypothetical protein [Chloroflexota bacterium]